MPRLPKFGQELAEAQRRIASILDREAVVKAPPTTATVGKEPESSRVQDKAQEEIAPPDDQIVGGEVIRNGYGFGYQQSLTIGSYDTTVSVVNVDPITDGLQTPRHLDLDVEFRVSGVVVGKITFSEPLSFGSELTKATRLTMRSGGVGGTPVAIVGINKSGYAVRVGIQFHRELEL